MSDLQPPRPELYETRAVHLVLRLLRQADERHRVRDHTVRLSDNDDLPDSLSFGGFERVFPSFPIVLRSQTLSEYGPATPKHLQVMVLHPDRSIIVRMYLYLRAQIAEAAASGGGGDCRGRPVGMHFPAGGLPGGMVLHDHDLGSAGAAVVTITKRGLGMLRLQPLADLVKAIRGRGWTPTTPLTRTGDDPVFDPLAPLDPRIRRLLGRNTSALILNLLVNLTTSRVPGELCRSVEVAANVRWIGLDQDRIGRLIDRGTRAVKIAIRDLHRRRLICIKRNVVGNIYAVAPDWSDQLAQSPVTLIEEDVR